MNHNLNPLNLWSKSPEKEGADKVTPRFFFFFRRKLSVETARNLHFCLNAANKQLHLDGVQVDVDVLELLQKEEAGGHALSPGDRVTLTR